MPDELRAETVGADADGAARWPKNVDRGVALQGALGWPGGDKVAEWEDTGDEAIVRVCAELLVRHGIDRGCGVRPIRGLWLSIPAWALLWAFWLVVTRGHHPSLLLAVVVTTSLMVSYATAATVHHLVLLPVLRATGRRVRYACQLVALMVVLTGVALAVIRVSYWVSHGPDPDPFGAYKHFAIDLFGMAVHLGLAALVVRAWRRLGDRRGGTRDAAP